MGEEAGVGDARPGGRAIALSSLESTDPTKNRSAFHSALAPSENFAGPCSKRTTKPKVKTARRINLTTNLRRDLIARTLG
jgi:hypothetical protein